MTNSLGTILGIILILIIVGTIIGLSFWGIKLCKKDQVIGLIPLFIALNFLGLLIGFIILYEIYKKKKENENNSENNN